MTSPTTYYPTPQHAQAAEAIVQFFQKRPETEAVLLVNSCARGKATRDSCLDIIMLTTPETLAHRYTDLETAWETFYNSDPVFQALHAAGKYSVVHPDFIHGDFQPHERDEVGAPDDFEIQIGNFLAYSVPLWEKSDYYTSLKAKWLPYYPEDLRRERLKMVHWYCLNDLHHIPLYAARGLHFQCFDRFYNAFQEFLQALFINRHTYPIAYNKWIEAQFIEILDMPVLYQQLTELFAITPFNGSEIAKKGAQLETLLREHTM